MIKPEQLSAHDLNPKHDNDNDSNRNAKNLVPNLAAQIPVAPTDPSFDDDEVPSCLIDYHALATDNKLSPSLFRESVINKTLSVLTALKHPNVLLVGDAGVGKTAIVEDIALRLHNQDPLVCDLLGAETRIYELPLNSLMSGTSFRGELEERLEHVIRFISNPDNHAILFIDEVHQLFSNNESYQACAQALKPALARTDFHSICATTTQETKTLRSDPAFKRRFTEVVVQELTDDETVKILEYAIPKYQKHHGVTIPKQLMPYVVQVANGYANSYMTHRPDSALTVLDNACADLHLDTAKAKILNISITPTLTENVIKHAALRLLSIKRIVEPHDAIVRTKERMQNIIGQNKAKQALIEMIEFQAMNICPRTKPYSYLFAGQTGTGKTEIAKQLADAVFGSKENIIYFNMTEYSSRADVWRLLGATEGHVDSDSNRPRPLDGLITNPYQIIVLDELEKAHPAVRNIFMQALDEGFITDSRGQILDFSHAIVIATTNAGVELINQRSTTVGFCDVELSQKDMTDALKQSFAPELLNRFENVVMFESLNKTDYAKVLGLKYNQLIKRIEKHKPNLQITPKQVDLNNLPDFILKLADESYNPAYNGRPAERTVKTFVESNVFNNNLNF